MIIYDVYRHDRSISPAALVRMSVKHWSRGLLTWRPVWTPQLQKVQAAMSVTYHRESEQNSPSVLVTQDRQPPSPEAFIRFQRLPGFRLLRKHATALTTLQGTVKPGRLKTQAHNPAVNQEDPIYAAIWTETPHRDRCDFHYVTSAWSETFMFRRPKGKLSNATVPHNVSRQLARPVHLFSGTLSVLGKITHSIKQDGSWWVE